MKKNRIRLWIGAQSSRRCRYVVRPEGFFRSGKLCHGHAGNLVIGITGVYWICDEHIEKVRPDYVILNLGTDLRVQ